MPLLILKEKTIISRLHVHGLNTSYVKRYGFVSELTLLQVYNAVYKESKALCLNIYDAKLSCSQIANLKLFTFLLCHIEC